MKRPTKEHGIDRQIAAARPLLKKYGLDKPINKGPLQYDWQEIDRQTVVLWKEVRKRDESRTKVRGGGISDAFVNYLATIFLSCYHVAAEPIPQSLLHLISYQLKAHKFGYSYHRRPSALEAAKEYLRNHPSAKDVQIAKDVNVNRTTVGRWRKKGVL